MEKGDKGSMLTRMGVSGWMFLLVPAYPGCPGQTAVKWQMVVVVVVVVLGDVLAMAWSFVRNVIIDHFRHKWLQRVCVSSVNPLNAVGSVDVSINVVVQCGSHLCPAVGLNIQVNSACIYICYFRTNGWENPKETLSVSVWMLFVYTTTSCICRLRLICGYVSIM